MNKDRFISQVTSFMIGAEGQALANFRKTNKAYDNLVKENTNNSTPLQNLIYSLDVDKAVIVEKFKETTYRINDLENDMLYLQGYRDCIKLLKHLGIL